MTLVLRPAWHQGTTPKDGRLGTVWFGQNALDFTVMDGGRTGIPL